MKLTNRQKASRLAIQLSHDLKAGIVSDEERVRRVGEYLRLKETPDEEFRPTEFDDSWYYAKGEDENNNHAER